MGGVHIDVTTLERKCYFFSKVADVFSVLQGFGTPKIKKKSVSNRWYMCKFEKKVALSRGRCEHRCHHAAARDLLFETIFRCMTRFAMFFWPVRVWDLFGCGAVYILIWCSVCGQVPRPHASKMVRCNPTSPPMSYETPANCVCKYLGDASACTQIKTLTHDHKLV